MSEKKEKEGKNKENNHKQHAADGYITEYGYDRYSKRYADKRRNRETVQHDSSCCCNALSAFKTEKHPQKGEQ